MTPPKNTGPLESTQDEIKSLRQQLAELEDFFTSAAPIKFANYKRIAEQLRQIEAAPLPSVSRPTPQKAIEGVLLAAQKYLSKKEIIQALEARGHFDGPSKRAEKTSFYSSVTYNTEDTNNFPWLKINGVLYVGLPGFEEPAHRSSDEVTRPKRKR